MIAHLHGDTNVTSRHRRLLMGGIVMPPLRWQTNS